MFLYFINLFAYQNVLRDNENSYYRAKKKLQFLDSVEWTLKWKLQNFPSKSCFALSSWCSRKNLHPLLWKCWLRGSTVLSDINSSISFSLILSVFNKYICCSLLRFFFFKSLICRSFKNKWEFQFPHGFL